MDNLKGFSNLKSHILDKIEILIGHKLLTSAYYDACGETELTTNNNGIDIITHQLELVFEDANPIFISWASIENWFQYSLCVSENSFCAKVERFTKFDNYWKSIIGKKLTNFIVYGYKKNIISITEIMNEKTITKTYSYFYEPHY